MVSPFGTTLPLTSAPYYSRINDNFTSYTDPKNYYLLAFNPGYALQASELNEIQENFFLNLNLTQRMNSGWSANGYKIPHWEGMIPLNPLTLSFTEPTITNSTLTFTVTFPVGWYLWTDPSSKMSFWVYSDTERSINVSTTGSVGIGFIGTTETITCCPNETCDETQDADIRDNSQGDTNTYNTCGASRKNVKFTSVEVRSNATQTSTFFPVLRASVNGSNITITYADNQTAYSTS
jgi:hypothetical protein